VYRKVAVNIVHITARILNVLNAKFLYKKQQNSVKKIERRTFCSSRANERESTLCCVTASRCISNQYPIIIAYLLAKKDSANKNNIATTTIQTNHHPISHHDAFNTFPSFNTAPKPPPHPPLHNNPLHHFPSFYLRQRNKQILLLTQFPFPSRTR
jgi:hypothetical protein